MSAFANSAPGGFTYRMVLARDGCATTVAVLDAAPRYANSSGLIGTTRGTVPAGIPAGTYLVCTKSDAGVAATWGATLLVG